MGCDNHAIDDCLHIEPAPGHTPGHVIVKFEQGGERALFCGDAIHHALQVYAPHWNHVADENPSLAQVARRRILEHCAESGSLLLPTHLGALHAARISDGAEGFGLHFLGGRNSRSAADRTCPPCLS